MADLPLSVSDDVHLSYKNSVDEGPCRLLKEGQISAPSSKSKPSTPVPCASVKRLNYVRAIQHPRFNTTDRLDSICANQRLERRTSVFLPLSSHPKAVVGLRSLTLVTSPVPITSWAKTRPNRHELHEAPFRNRSPRLCHSYTCSPCLP